MGNKQNNVSPEVLFGNIIRQHRIQQGLTQSDLEGEDRLERSYISRLEAGQYQVCLRGILHLAFIVMSTSQGCDFVSRIRLAPMVLWLMG